MYCNSCGAEINDNVVICPFCGAEVEENARKAHEAEIAEMNRETGAVIRSTRKGPSVNNVTKWLVLGAAIFVAVILGIIVFRTMTGRVNESREEKYQKDAIETLEKLYQEGKYDEMYTTYTNLNVYGGLYDKYEIAGRMAHNMTYWIDDLEKVEDKYKRGYYTSIEWELYEAMDDLYQIDQAEKNNFPCGEKDAMLFFKDKIRTVLTEKCLLTEEEIDAEMARFPEVKANHRDDYGYEDLSALCYERYVEIHGEPTEDDNLQWWFIQD